MKEQVLNQNTRFYQWETDQRLTIEDVDCDEARFSHVSVGMPVSVPVQNVSGGKQAVDVPDIMLQVSGWVKVYLVKNSHTLAMYNVPVLAAEKPSDYVYTETEVLSLKSLEARVANLEKNGGAGGSLPGQRGEKGDKGDPGPKGDKGDPGNPAVLVTAAIEYQASDSGTVIPSGAWTSAIPMVGPGRYLWTRTTSTFNTGSPVVSYSVSRMGIDGTGSVVSVNNQSPDANGNITIDASALGAMSKYGATMEGPLNMNGQTLGGLNDPASDGEAVPKRYVDLKTAVVPASVTSGNFLVGNGQGVMQSKTPTQVRESIGAMQDYTAVPVSKGGTGLKSVASGNFLVGTGTDTLAEKTPAEVQMLFGSTKWTELYTNPDPTSNFGSRTLQRDMTPYNMVAIQYNHGTGETARVASFAFGLVPLAGIATPNNMALYSFSQSTANNVSLRRRYVQITRTYIAFESGYANEKELDAACIPIRVYGISGMNIVEGEEGE